MLITLLSLLSHPLFEWRLRTKRPLLNENFALIVKVMCGRNHLDIPIFIDFSGYGSPPDDEIRSAIHKVALSLYHLVSKKKNKNKSLEWILTNENDFLESIGPLAKRIFKNAKVSAQILGVPELLLTLMWDLLKSINSSQMQDVATFKEKAQKTFNLWTQTFRRTMSANVHCLLAHGADFIR